MRWAKLLVITLVVTGTLQSLLGQTSKLPANGQSNTSEKLDTARAAGFDFARLSDLSRKAAVLNGNRPQVSVEARLDPKQSRLLANEGVCFTLRVYKFAQKDGEAPHMVGSTTCTPAQSVEPREAEGTDEFGHKVRYFPGLFHPL